MPQVISFRWIPILIDGFLLATDPRDQGWQSV